MHREFSVKRLKAYPAGAGDDFASDGTYYQVDHIVDRRRAADGTFEYKVRWLGHLPADDTWEPLSSFNMNGAQEVALYNRTHPFEPNSSATHAQSQSRSPRTQPTVTSEQHAEDPPQQEETASEDLTPSQLRELRRLRRSANREISSTEL